MFSNQYIAEMSWVYDEADPLMIVVSRPEVEGQHISVAMNTLL